MPEIGGLSPAAWKNARPTGCWTARPRSPAPRRRLYWVSPAAPTPMTLPVSIWIGVAALSISSMTRLDFSSATLVAIHIP